MLFPQRLMKEALCIVSMKELTLINRYHQTQERPKPPVEQRVKVMDTLDKRMQTILEREDLSEDERLKLLLFIFFNKSCTLAFIVFGTLSKISLSIRSCLTGSGATATGLGM
jgi:hypothetical protein